MNKKELKQLIKKTISNWVDEYYPTSVEGVMVIGYGEEAENIAYNLAYFLKKDIEEIQPLVEEMIKKGEITIEDSEYINPENQLSFTDCQEVYLTEEAKLIEERKENIDSIYIKIGRGEGSASDYELIYKDEILNVLVEEAEQRLENYGASYDLEEEDYNKIRKLKEFIAKVKKGEITMETIEDIEEIDCPFNYEIF